MKLKDEYNKLHLEIYSPNMKLKTILTNQATSELLVDNIETSFKRNEMPTLSFDLPVKNKELNDGSNDDLVKFGFDYYIIKNIKIDDSDMVKTTVSCVHKSDELRGILCPVIEIIGATASNIFNKILMSVKTVDLTTKYKFGETNITDSTRRSLVTTEEKTVYENLISMAESFDAYILFKYNRYGEITINLYKKEDMTSTIKNPKFFIKGKNLKDMGVEIDSSDITTQLMVYGAKDKMGRQTVIESVNPTGNNYVEDYSYYLNRGMTLAEIKNNPQCLQMKSWTNENVSDPQELFELGKQQVKSICLPKLSGTINMYDLTTFEGETPETIEIGDSIVACDSDLGYSISCFVSGITRNYNNPQEPKIDIENVIEYSNATFKDLVHTANKVNEIMGSDGSESFIVGNHVQGLIDATKASFQAQLDNSHTIENPQSVLISDSRTGSATYGAMCLGTSGFLIADHKDSNGQWVWTTFGNGKGFTADCITAGVMNANLIKTGILSAFNGSTWINMDDGTFNFANKLIHDGFTTKFMGDVITYSNNNKAIELSKQNMLFYDWGGSTRTEPVGMIHSTRTGLDPNKCGIVMANYKNALMYLSYYDMDLNEYYPYITFDEQNIMGYKCAITFRRHFALKEYKAFFGQNNQSQISGSNTTLDFVISDGGGINFKNHSGKHFLYITDNDGYKVNVDSLQVNGDFNVIGNKNAIQKTEHYGTRAVHCYEMADTYWGDLGEGIINKDGECIVYIEDVFREMINTDINYHVFTQVYNGNIKEIKRYKDYFIVTGEPKTEFSWELKARRKGFENNRLEDANFSLNSNLINLLQEIEDNNIKLKDANIKLEDSLNKRNNLEDLI